MSTNGDQSSKVTDIIDKIAISDAKWVDPEINFSTLRQETAATTNDSEGCCLTPVDMMVDTVH